MDRERIRATGLSGPVRGSHFAALSRIVRPRESTPMEMVAGAGGGQRGRGLVRAAASSSVEAASD